MIIQLNMTSRVQKVYNLLEKNMILHVFHSNRAAAVSILFYSICTTILKE